MKKEAIVAATIAGATGLGLSPVFAKECNASSQPDHQYTYNLVRHESVLSAQKITIMDTIEKYRADVKNGVVDAQDVPDCNGPLSFVIEAKKSDFLRTQKEGGKISASISTLLKARPEDERACLDVPVKDNKVVFAGTRATLSFQLDESNLMMGTRRGFLFRSFAEALHNVECYSFAHGPIVIEEKRMTPLPPRRPALIGMEQMTDQKPQEPTITIPNIFKQIFGG